MPHDPSFIVAIVMICTGGWLINNWIRAKHGYALEDEWGGKTARSDTKATEALKVLLGIGEPLIGRLLLWDALEGSFTELTVKRDPHCVACGDGKREGSAA